jgi:hypothetical protein
MHMPFAASTHCTRDVGGASRSAVLWLVGLVGVVGVVATADDDWGVVIDTS